MTRLVLAGLFAVLLASPSLPARAAGFIQDEIGAGGRGLFINNASALVQFQDGLAAGVEHTVYSLGALPRSVNAFKARLAYERDGSVWGLRPVVYPKIMGASALGGALFHSKVIDSDEDTQTQAGFALGGVRHEAPVVLTDGGGAQRTFGEYFAEGQVMGSFFQTFQLGLVADAFLYDMPFRDVSDAGSLFNQADLTSAAAIRPLTRMPRAAATVQFVRAGEPGLETHFFLNYSYLIYEPNQGFAHSVLAGLDLKLSDLWRLDVSEHLLREQGSGLLATTSLLVRLSY